MSNRCRPLALLAFWTLLFLLASLAGCGGDDDDTDGGPPPSDDDLSPDDDADDDDDGLPEWLTIPAGQMTVRVRTRPYSMEILDPDGRTLLATPEVTKAPANLSPMPFLPHAYRVGEVRGTWFYATEVTALEDATGQTRLTLWTVDLATGAQEGSLVLTFDSPSDRHLVVTAGEAGVPGFTCHTGAYRLDPDEHFFGLGLQYDSIDSRGKLRNMFQGLGVDLTDQIQNHAPMPFYLSSRGYGLFVSEDGKGFFDMGRGSREAHGYMFRTDALTTHIFWGPDPLGIISEYTALTGRPPMNPDFLFGHLHWRNVNHSEAEIYSDATELRAHGIPTSSIMVDAPWSTAYSTFQFAQCPEGCLFTDAQAVIDHVHQKGYAFYLWTAEFVNRVSPVEAPGMVEDNSAQFDFARNSGYLIPLFGIWYEYPWWHDNGAMVNFLHPGAYEWYRDLARGVMEMGVQGFKMDGGEYVGADTVGLTSLGAFDLEPFADSNVAAYYYKTAYHDLFWRLAREYNGELGIATVRCAVWGEQKHVSYFWPGDMESSWSFELGLPAEIVGGLTLGTAGFPYYGANNGGFSGYDQDDELLFARWTEYSAFRPIFESSRDGTQEIWEVYPPRIEELYRRYAVLHTRLFPYMKAYAKEATETGHPIMRMLPLIFMDDPATYDRDFDYLLGDWLLVAPVYEEGAFTRDVYLPAGRWIDYWTNQVHDGPAELVVDAPEDVIPVFARAGAIVPLLDASVETLWPTDDPEIVDHTDVADRLWVELYPSGSSSFRLADGTRLAMAQDAAGFTLTVSGAPFARTYSLRAVPGAYGAGVPAAVAGPSGALESCASYEAWDAAERGWFYDAATGNLWIRDACAAGTFTVTAPARASARRWG